MIRAKRILCALLSVVMITVLAACANNSKKQVNRNAAIYFTDDAGKEISLDAPAERIISLYSAHTENLYSLGAEDRLIGNYHTAVYPPEAAKLDMYDYSADPEKIITANPDVVIIRPHISRTAPDFVEALLNAGICVVSLYPDSLDKFDDYINKLAALTGTEEKASELLDKFHSELQEITALTKDSEPKQSVFFESTETNIRTTTPDSMAGQAITMAGGINVASDAVSSEKGGTIAEYGIERVLEKADDIDVYVSQRGAMNSGGSLESIAERDGYDVIKAVKNKRVYTINEKLISSPTFRYVKGVREMARYLCPDIMDNYDEYRNDKEATRKDFANLIVKHEHMPIYIPSSSKYYDTPAKGHTFGLFEDVKWQDNDFDYIETAVYSGAVLWTKDGDKEYFHPDKSVTREELAKAVFVLGDFASNGKDTPVSDLSECDNSRIVQILVDNGVFDLNGGSFEPERSVTNNEIIAALDML
ncbi:MAG: ABC transporter substrate-binding protein [Oscillospiraceae bacterium]|nr:ABC transporter substrate-binding protein [Oscillospiraceae bacterium]